MTLQLISSRFDPPFPPAHLAHHPTGTTTLRCPRQTAYSDAVDFLPALRHGAAAAKGSRSRMEDRHRVETLPHMRMVSADASTAQEDAAAQPEDGLSDVQQQQQQQQQQPQPAFFAVRDALLPWLCKGMGARQSRHSWAGPRIISRAHLYQA